MFTPRLIGDTKNIELRRRMINVEFTDGTVTFNKEFQFSISETVEAIKKTIKEYVTEINTEAPAIIGDITDVPVEPAPTEPTAAELAFTEWQKDRADLKKMKELVAEGIIAADATQLATLQAKVNTGWKNAYFNQI